MFGFHAHYVHYADLYEGCRQCLIAGRDKDGLSLMPVKIVEARPVVLSECP